MNVVKQEAAVVRARRPAARTKKRGRTALLAVVAVFAAYVWINANAWERWIPLEWFRDIPETTDLHPAVAAGRDRLIAESAAIGIDILITDGFRSSEAQDALYRKGRGDEGAVVTHAKGGESYHNYGLAIDFALRIPGGKVVWDMEYDGNGNGRSDWLEVVSLAKKIGFSWGGDWESFRDYPHLQMDFGYSIGELQRGWRPPSTTD